MEGAWRGGSWSERSNAVHILSIRLLLCGLGAWLELAAHWAERHNTPCHFTQVGCERGWRAGPPVSAPVAQLEVGAHCLQHVQREGGQRGRRRAAAFWWLSTRSLPCFSWLGTGGLPCFGWLRNRGVARRSGLQECGAGVGVRLVRTLLSGWQVEAAAADSGSLRKRLGQEVALTSLVSIVAVLWLRFGAITRGFWSLADFRACRCDG